MQAIAFACSILFVILDFAQPQNQDDNGSSLYTRRYEHLDIDTILASPRLVTNYVECLLNKKPCAPEGKALKRILPEALRTKCSRCWPSQKEGALKVITSLYYNYPHYYKALREKWDPTGEYNRRFEEYLRDQKFNSIGGNGDSEPGEQAQASSVSINITQRPIRQDEVSPSVQGSDLPEIVNRFGGDDNGGYEYDSPRPTTLPSPSAQRPQSGQQPQRPQQPQQPQRPQPAAPSPTPSRRPSNGGNSISSSSSSQPASVPSNSGSNSVNVPTHTWTQNNLPAPGLSTTTTYYLNTQNPVLNIINRITMKFANTAEFIAGMLRGAVPQPQASKHKADPHRSFCDRLRKTLNSYKKNTRTVNRHRRH